MLPGAIPNWISSASLDRFCRRLGANEARSADLARQFSQLAGYLFGHFLDSTRGVESGVVRRRLFKSPREVAQGSIETGRKIGGLSIDAVGHLPQQRGATFIEATLCGWNVGRHVCFCAEDSVLHQGHFYQINRLQL